jgi:hypothetical protein
MAKVRKYVPSNTAPVINSNGGGTSAFVSLGENSTSVTDVNATDADLPAQTLIYSIVGGADASLFTIVASTGVLSFKTAPDYENPFGSNSDNVYDVTVRVSDGTLTDTQAIAVMVYNVNDAPIITSDGGGSSASVSVPQFTTVSVPQFTTFVTDVNATDADLPAQTLIYSITGGADSSLFTIVGTTGELSFVSAPDFGNPQDSGSDNTYNVTVQVSDGTLTDTQDIAVTVTGVSAPEF